jgi:hypothetical protein
MTSGKIRRMPNQPKTPKRSIRIPDDLWTTALQLAKEDNEILAEEIRKMLESYVRRKLRARNRSRP